MEKQSEYNERSEKKYNLKRFVALIPAELRKACKSSGFTYSLIVEIGLKELLKRKGKK